MVDSPKITNITGIPAIYNSKDNPEVESWFLIPTTYEDLCPEPSLKYFKKHISGGMVALLGDEIYDNYFIKGIFIEKETDALIVRCLLDELLKTFPYVDGVKY